MRGGKIFSRGECRIVGERGVGKEILEFDFGVFECFVGKIEFFRW